MSVLYKMNSKLDSLNSSVNELTGTVFELKNENACMKKRDRATEEDRGGGQQKTERSSVSSSVS